MDAMGGSEGETRVLIAHCGNASSSKSCSSGSRDSCLLSLRHPKSELAVPYLHTNGALKELHWFKQPFGSWFIGDYVCEDGGLYMATPVDPVFIFLPIFEAARMKKEDDLGKFRNLDEILFVDGYPGYTCLYSMVEECMGVVCEVKEVGSMKFYRLDDAKVLTWLSQKVVNLKLTLPTLSKMYSVRNEKDTLIDAVSLLGEYVKDEPWMKLLCDHLRLDMPTSKKERPMIEPLPFVSEVSPPQNNKEKTISNKKQPKKAKVETGSKNIREMFHRASSRNGGT